MAGRLFGGLLSGLPSASVFIQSRPNLGMVTLYVCWTLLYHLAILKKNALLDKSIDQSMV